MKNIFMVLILVLTLGMVDSKVEESVDVWYRTVPDLNNDGKTTIGLDMSAGFAYCDGEFIYLMVKKKDIDELIVMTFVNGDYWINDESYWRPQENKENDMRERFLKNHLNKGGKIERLD